MNVDAQEMNNGRDMRFSNITEAGYLWGIGNAILSTGGIYVGGSPSNFIKYKNNYGFVSLMTINGFEFSRNKFLGLGVGIDYEKSRINLPICAVGRLYLFNKNVGPLFNKKLTSFIDLSVGYALNWMAPSVITATNSNGSYMTYVHSSNPDRGGAMANAQFGIRVYIFDNFSWVFGLGYRFQHIRYGVEFKDSQGLLIGSYRSDELTHFLTVKSGFVF